MSWTDNGDELLIDDDINNDDDFFHHNSERAQCQEILDNLNANPETNPNEFGKLRKEFMRATQHQDYQTCEFGDAVNVANLDDFGKELKKLGVEIRILNGEEFILFTGNLNVVEIVERINRTMAEINKIQTFTRLTQEFLHIEELNFNLLTTPMQSSLGVQDTFMRALLLSKPFQSLAFNLLITKLDKIGRTKRNGADNVLNELGQRCIAHLRYVDLVFNSKSLFDLIFEKQISLWNSPLRESFIEILPEIFMDNNIHHDVFVHLYTMVVESGLQNLAAFRQSLLKAMSLFVTDNPSIDKIRLKLLERIMDFEPVVIREIVNFVLNSFRRNDNTFFKVFLVQLKKYFDFSKLKKLPEDNSAESTDEIVAEIFELIAAYVRVNVNKAVKDFQLCLTGNADATLNKSQNNDEEISEGNEIEEETEENEINKDDHLQGDLFLAVFDVNNERAPSKPSLKKQNLELIDVFLIFVIQSVRPDPKLAIGIFKSQINLSTKSENLLLKFLEKVLSYKKFNLTFFTAILQVSYNLISAESEVSKLGGFILKQLFIVLPKKGKEIIEHLLVHLNEIDVEAKDCLDALTDITNLDAKLLFPYLNRLIDTLDNLHMLKLKNCRQLFYVLSTLNLKWRNERRLLFQPNINTQNKDDVLKVRIDKLLASDCNQEKIWGIVGSLMQIKAYLDFIKSEEANYSLDNASQSTVLLKKKMEVENYIELSINRLKSSLDGNSVVIAEFFYQLGQLIGEQNIFVPKSNSLCKFGHQLFQEFRERFYKNIGNNGDHVLMSYKFSQFEAPKFVNKNSSLWLDTSKLITSLIFTSKDLNDLIVEIIPMLLLLREFAKYEHNLYSKPSCKSIELSTFYAKFFFVLESNISLSRLASSDTAELSRDSLQVKCHVLYFVIEYIRTVLNMFAGCHNKESPINECMLKKFELLLECQSHMVQCIKQLKDYVLPNLSHLLPCSINIQYREKSEVTKIKRRMRMLNSITETATNAIQAARNEGTVIRSNKSTSYAVIKRLRGVKQEIVNHNESTSIHNAEVVDSCFANDSILSNMGFESSLIENGITATPTHIQRLSQEENDALINNSIRTNVTNLQPSINETNENFVDENYMDDDMIEESNISIQALRKRLIKASKNNVVSVEQLSWYFTPFRLQTIGRLLELVRLKRRHTALLIENLSKILKKILPAANKRKAPAGFGKTSIADALMEDALIDQDGTIEDNWTVLFQVLPVLFDILEHCATNFRQNTAQTTPVVHNDHGHELMNIMHSTLQIFCQIFQSKDIQTNDTALTTDKVKKKNYRFLVMSILAEKINQHNLSNQPMNNETSSMLLEMGTLSVLHPNESRTSAEQEELMVDFFIEIGHLVVNIASANTVLQVLACFNQNLSESHLQNIYELSLFFLSKDWKDEEHDTIFQKHYIEILNNYLNLRAENERLGAIHWLIVNQLNCILPEQNRRAKCLDEPSKEREELIGNYADMHFSSINKKSFSNVHKLLFQRLNLFVTNVMCSDVARKMNTDKLVELWRTTAQCFFYLVINIRIKELRSLSFLQNCVREGRKFIAQFCVKSCSFKSILNKNKVGRFTQETCYIIRQIQLGNRLIQDISIYAKAVKFTAILKLLPDLRATSELFLREIHSALVNAGLEDVMKIGFLKQRNIDGKNINSEADVFGAAGNRKQSTSRKRSTTGRGLALTKMEPEENDENINVET